MDTTVATRSAIWLALGPSWALKNMRNQTARLTSISRVSRRNARLNSPVCKKRRSRSLKREEGWCVEDFTWTRYGAPSGMNTRSEEHTSELQSRGHLVC